jgi:GntR family transcriptional regulator
MLIVVDPGTGVPVYRQVMDQVKLQVACGRLTPGDELPSTRALSTELGVNPMTISKAYSFLEKEGIVERRPGRPVVVKGNGGPGAAGTGKELLRDELAGTVTMVRQLEIEPEEAVALFRSMLSKSEEEETP